MASRRGLGLSIVVIAAALAGTAAALEVTSETAPAAFAVRVDTTKGPFVVEAYRAWAPQAVDRFYNMARSGYLDGNLFFRVVAKDGVDFGISGDPRTTKAWEKSPIPCDPPRRKIQVHDVFLLNNGTGENAAIQIRIQTGADTSDASRSGAAALGRVVEGAEVLAAIDASHMKDARKWQKMVRTLANDGVDEVRKSYPKIDSIVRATVIDRAVEVPKEEPAADVGKAVPAGMALVRVYREDASPQKFTLRVDGTARAVLPKGSVFEVLLPAGRHELSSKVKFKMFATGIGDKAFASRDTFVAELAPGAAYHVHAAPVGDGRTLQLYLVANDFGVEECRSLAPAKPLEVSEEE